MGSRLVGSALATLCTCWLSSILHELGAQPQQECMHLPAPKKQRIPKPSDDGTYDGRYELEEGHMEQFGCLEGGSFVIRPHIRPTKYHAGRVGHEPTIEDLVDEVTREGYGHLLTLSDPSARYRTLQEKAVALESHPRNYDAWKGKHGRPAVILAVILYTGSDIFADFNSDKRSFYAKSMDTVVTPRFPILDALFMEA